MLNQCFPNLDIWNKFLAIFREKRKASLAIALLSPWLTELALDVLWKDMTTLVPIFSVANSGGEFIDYRVSDGRGCWRVSENLEITEKFLDDLIRNFKRIHNLRVQVSGKELELWQMLHAFLVPRSMVYLLPCLQTLYLTSANDPQSHPFLGIISYIFAPSLTAITVSGCWGTSWTTVQHHMNSHQLPNLYRLRYFDPTLENYPCVSQRWPTLGSLRCLEKLAISIQLNHDESQDPSTISLTLPELRELRLGIGDEKTLGPFFSGGVKLPSLSSLLLDIHHGLSRELPLGPLAAAYPNLLYLALAYIQTQDHSYIMSANDLMKIGDVRGMKDLKLINFPHELQERDIFSLVKSLPDFHSLVVTRPEPFSATLLISISQISNLRCVELPLDFSLLVDHRSSEETPESPSELRKIFSLDSLGIPAKSSSQLALIRNMLRLFPKLEVLRGYDESMEELRDLFEAVNNMFYKPQ
ncbi:hypothetical protein Agabi119p4_8956 [Agaricus bisporus var. burnettii]|uniref:Uncharacterized protein n=1 Tax=Agaricus bisporus var. burnettii TaxID=192524 RepID=A0A8H7C5E5_AGABI|nr:hypothetical protein Agabi119p4_8956 [Agaricus bisporus var. burnettii]